MGRQAINKLSWSQSVSIWLTFKKFPDVSPFTQSVCFDRLKKVALPESIVAANEAWFI